MGNRGSITVARITARRIRRPAVIAVLSATTMLAGTGPAAAAPVSGHRDGHGGGHGRADAAVVVDWNVIALRTAASAPVNPPRESRSLAIVQAAVWDAVRSAERGGDDDGNDDASARERRPDRGSPAAAAIAAAHATLVALYPDQRAGLDTSYRDSVAALPPGRDTDRGLDLGAMSAADLLARRADDGSATPAVFDPVLAPGVWRPTPPAFRPAMEPGWGGVRPFLLASAGQFRPGPPPALTGRRYARDLHEVQRLGSADSTSRTAEQTSIARFWVSTAPQEWNQPVQQLAVARHLDIATTARAFAMLNLAGADAMIAAWDAKYEYAQWRPVTAIRAADTDGNPATTADPAWTPLLVTPPFPDDPAGHSAYAGAAETVLTSIFGRHPGDFRLVSATAPGVVQHFADFHAVASQVNEARVWGGVHWRTSVEVGRVLGQHVGRYALHHAPDHH